MASIQKILNKKDKLDFFLMLKVIYFSKTGYLAKQKTLLMCVYKQLQFMIVRTLKIIVVDCVRIKLEHLIHDNKICDVHITYTSL